tara:strand:+ start:1441 stop:2262 length:822 start_codon:yes stop_codon:yes gene_type:complete
MVSKLKKIAFCTHVSDDWFFPVGADKLVTSFKHFHPDIPFFVFGTNELNQLNAKYGGQLTWDNMHPMVTKAVMDMGYELVAHVDADSIVTGEISKWLQDADVFTVRNNNDKGWASKDNNPPITVNECGADEYMNAGFVASSSKEFIEEWITRNLTELKTGHFFYQEQDILNIMLQEDKYKTRCLDPKNVDRHFGISCLDGKEGYWDNLKDLDIKYEGKDTHLSYNSKTINLIHQAGGHSLPKLVLETLFSPEVAEYLKGITSGPISFEKPTLL